MCKFDCVLIVLVDVRKSKGAVGNTPRGDHAVTSPAQP